MSKSTADSLGRPRLPLRRLYIPAILDILQAGACDIQAQSLVHSTMSENRISALLDQRMRAIRAKSKASDIISWFMRPLIHDESELSLGLVEPDFLFTWGLYPSREDPSVVVEAKRIRGSGQSLAGKYVSEGVMRFVDGSYGRGHDFGIMMGYVVAGPLSRALSSVGAAMHQRKCRTRQRRSFAPSYSICSIPNIHQSTHLQRGTMQPIALVHVFVDFS